MLIRGLMSLILVGVCAGSASAVEILVDWSGSFLFSTSGALENPLVRVGFNPQPEPPGRTLVDLSDPFAPMLSRDTMTPTFRILFAIGNTTPFTLMTAGVPDDGHFAFQALGPTGATLFNIGFDMGTSSAGVPDPLSWVGFNPQPEPPGFSSAAASAGFDFEFTSLSTASLVIHISDAQGNALAFSRVPEPGVLALLSVGNLGVVILRRRRRPVFPARDTTVA